MFPNLLYDEMLNFLDNATALTLEKTTCKFQLYGSPYVWRFDGSMTTKPGIGIRTLVEPKISTNSIENFRIRMLTEKWSGNSNILYVRNIFIDFFARSNGDEIATVVFDNKGNSALINSSNNKKEAVPESMHGDGFSFKFMKTQRYMTIITNLGVEVTMHRRTTVTIRVPYKKYFDNVDGLCGNIMHRYDCTDDETTTTPIPPRSTIAPENCTSGELKRLKAFIYFTANIFYQPSPELLNCIP